MRMLLNACAYITRYYVWLLEPLDSWWSCSCRRNRWNNDM